ncbi:hypothetical protein [Clostridium sp.]|uniref:hypothetical protein n=1 Tax=Clostridium sp. TaxID=1506 RepID=UPI0026117F72|nr:hypothetical protein [Clostridium sp.]
MDFWMILLMADMIPIGLFILGGYYETKYSRYPEVKKGYKNKYTVLNKVAWEYGNKLASKIYGTAGTALLVLNTIILFIFGENAFITTLFISFMCTVLSRIIIEKLLEKKFKNTTK